MSESFSRLTANLRPLSAIHPRDGLILSARWGKATKYASYIAMLDRGARIAAACCVLVGGGLLALLFRHESPRTGQSTPTTGGRLVLRRHAEPTGGNSTILQENDAHRAVRPPADPRPIEPRPSFYVPPTPGETPPPLPHDYPGSRGSLPARWGTAIGLTLPDPARAKETRPTHEIVDGDTLGGLAERYLGSADRYLEIYEANRDVLSSPQVLPIGAKLKIPPRVRRPAEPEEPDENPARRRLVPVRPEQR